MNTVLDKVRAEYERMDLKALLAEMRRQGFDPEEELPYPFTKENVVNFLMAVEEFCAFH